MKLDEYQTAAASTAKYDREDLGIPPLVYCALGLAGEAGECADKLKKFYRDRDVASTLHHDLKKELGDVLWYVSEAARQLGYNLSEIALGNLAKLADRHARDTIGGSGDDR